MQQVLRRQDIDRVIAVTRKPLPEATTANYKLTNTLVQDYGNLQEVPEETWAQLEDADALVWAMGTYNLDENVNLNYPLTFQEELARRFATRKIVHGQKSTNKKKFKFVILSGAFVEPDQSKRLFFLGDQRKQKGVLQEKSLEFARAHEDEWESFIIRPGGISFGTCVEETGRLLFGKNLGIKSEELGAFVAHLVVNGSTHAILENAEMVDMGAKLLQEAK